MIFQSASEARAMQMTVDFLNSCPASCPGTEFADRMLALFKKMASGRIRMEDWNASVQTIRNFYRIPEDQWRAVAEYIRRETEQKSPIIISEN